MGNYRFDDDIHKEKQLPPGQRGIGCAMMLLLPVMSYLAAMILLEIPKVKSLLLASMPSLFGAPSIPRLLWKITAITPLLRIIYSWNNLEINITLGLIILLFLTGFIGVFYSIAYRAVVPKYGRLDAPPIKSKRKKKSR